MYSASHWISELQMQAHPEGGYWSPTYQAATSVSADALPERYAENRWTATGIHFLVEAGNFSAFHRLQSEELWLYHAGEAICLHLIHPDGTLEQGWVGPKISQGQALSVLVPAQVWFAAEVVVPTAYGLVSCIVSPGFDFADFELAERVALIGEFPQHEGLIQRLTRG